MSKMALSGTLRNRILLALSEPERSRLLEKARYTDLPRTMTLYRPDDRVDTIYFIDRGLISLVQEMPEGRTVEIGARGVEGVTTPEALVDDAQALFTSMVQIPCSALVVDLATVRREMAENPKLRRLIHGYFRVATHQIGLTAACNRLHSLEERCCRWLLIAHDSAGCDTFPLTHEFLAMMLGAPRSGVSIASDLLRRAGYIDYRRGEVTIKNRTGLETAACACYATIRSEFDHLFGMPPS